MSTAVQKNFIKEMIKENQYFFAFPTAMTFINIQDFILDGRTREQLMIALYQAIFYSNAHSKPYRWKKADVA